MTHAFYFNTAFFNKLIVFFHIQQKIYNSTFKIFDLFYFYPVYMFIFEASFAIFRNCMGLKVTVISDKNSYSFMPFIKSLMSVSTQELDN